MITYLSECEMDFSEHFGKFVFVEHFPFQKMLERPEMMIDTTLREILEMKWIKCDVLAGKNLDVYRRGREQMLA